MNNIDLHSLSEYVLLTLLLILFFQAIELIKIDLWFFKNKTRKKIFVVPSIFMSIILFVYTLEAIYQIVESTPKRVVLKKELGSGNNFVLICSQLIPDRFIRKIKLATDNITKVKVSGFENAGIPNDVIENIVNNTLPKGFRLNCGYGIKYVDLYKPMPKDYGYNFNENALSETKEKKPGFIYKVAEANGICITFYKTLKESPVIYALNRPLIHEVAHLNDFRLNRFLSLSQKAEIAMMIVNRIGKKNRYNSEYVEGLSNDDPKENKSNKANEYFAEIMEAYFNEEILHPDDEKICKMVIEITDPGFDIKKSIKDRGKIIDEFMASRQTGLSFYIVSL